MESGRVQILMVTRSWDNETTGWVAEAIRRRGHEAIRLDTDRYPHEQRISTSIQSGRVTRTLASSDGTVDLGAVKSVWFRRFAAGAGLPASLGDTRPGCLQEASWTLMGMLAALDCFHLDPYDRIHRAEYKELQYRVAAEIGLDVPPSLFSSDPRAVRQFARELGAPLVAKVQSKFIMMREGAEQVVFTSPVSDADLGELDSLIYCPMLFQARIPKALELRATVVGRRVFTAAIDSSGSDEGAVDWRKDESLSKGWRVYDLPPEVEERLVRLVAWFGLNYSAADFILTPDGRHVFLEINPAGEWAWLVRDLGLPIADAIAERLVSGSCDQPMPKLSE